MWAVRPTTGHRARSVDVSGWNGEFDDGGGRDAISRNVYAFPHCQGLENGFFSRENKIEDPVCFLLDLGSLVF